MKKFLVVLTILVLVAGFAFAAVTGYVEAKYKFDFTDAKELTYDINGKHSKVSFTVSTEQAKVDGSNKPYATVTVDVELSAEIKELERKPLKYEDDYAWNDTFDKFAFGVVLSDFRIVGENWEIDFLKAIAVGDYAKSAWEVGTNAAGKKDQALDAAWSFGKSKGITVTYDGYKVGVSAERRKDTEYTLDVKLRAESKELTLAEGVTGQVALGIGATKKGSADMSFDFGASVKAAYATDDLTVNAAADLQSVNKVFAADVAVKVAVKPVTVDAYYANKVEFPAYRYFFNDDIENVISVRVAIALDPVTVTVYGENLANPSRILAVKEEGKFGALTEDAQFGIMPSLGDKPIFGNMKAGLWFANAGVGYDVQENLNVNAHVGFERFYDKTDDFKNHLSGLAVQAGAVYKLEVATITANAYVGKVFAKVDNVDESSDLYFACNIAAESDKLVENATLSAALTIDKQGVIGLYNSTRAVDEFSNTGDYDFGDGTMNFTVACKVTF